MISYFYKQIKKTEYNTKLKSVKLSCFLEIVLRNTGLTLGSYGKH